MSEMVSLGDRKEKAMGVKTFLAGGCRFFFVIKNEVGSVDSFGGEAQESCLISVGIQRRRCNIIPCVV